MGLWLTSYFLLYKDVWEHHYVFILPILTTLYIKHQGKLLLLIYFVIAIPTPFILLDVHSGILGAIDPEREWTIAQSILYRSTKIMPTFLLWFWIIRKLLHKQHKKTETI